MDIRIAEENGEFKKLRFGGLHDAWFPRATPLTADLWGEYLSVFWSHPANAHYYLSHGTPIKSGDICIDCGACEGFFALQALAAGAQKVICVEAMTGMAEALRVTFAAQIKEGRVTVVHAAAGAVDATALFGFDSDQPFAAKLGPGQKTISVRVAPLASLCAELALPKVDFIKMDIEGAEIQAVEGAMPLLTAQRPRLAITTYHRPYDFAALRALLLSARYRRILPAGITNRGGGAYRPVMIHAC